MRKKGGREAVFSSFPLSLPESGGDGGGGGKGGKNPPPPHPRPSAYKKEEEEEVEGLFPFVEWRRRGRRMMMTILLSAYGPLNGLRRRRRG